ncbi:hypothetical protein MBLNU230_g0022t1 [Neophaeotheca triangularis]
MSMYVGSTVEVTLKHPSNTTFTGTVQEVVAGQHLSLRDVYFPATGARWEQWMVQGSALADLKIVEPPAGSGPTPPSQSQATAIMPAHAPPQAPAAQPEFPAAPVASGTPTAARQTPHFVDPAILSYAKSPAQTEPISQPPTAPPAAPITPIKSRLANATESLPTTSSPFVGAPTLSNYAAAQPQKPAELSTQPPTDTAPSLGHQDGVQESQSSKKKVRRGLKKGGAKTPAKTTQEQQPPRTVIDAEVSRNGHDMNDAVNMNVNGNAGARKGKGWRSTPLLQPSPQSGRGNKKHGKTGREQREVYNNGWATEDATDIQDLGDFDFEANHKLFDKKGVFDEIRQGDTTADEDRLVSHNKLAARPGTYGGKNLHPTENVLSPKLAPKYHSNELDGSSSEADTEVNFPTGRSSSRHSTTRAPASKKRPSRQNSLLADGRQHPLAASLSSQRATNGSATSLVSKGGKPLPGIATASHQGRKQSPRSAISRSRKPFDDYAPGTEPSEPHFIVRNTGAPCPVLHPTALETLEMGTTSRYGLTPDAMTETAARNIAELALSMSEALPSSTSRRASRVAATGGRASMSTSRALNTEPVVVILVGNHATGARAVAAVRHLVNRDARIILAEASYPDRYRSLDGQPTQLAKQLSTVKKLARSGRPIKRGNWTKANNYIKSLSGPPAVIIDALLAGEPYENLDPALHTEARSIIDWANRSRAPVLSLSCPTGVSGLDGTSTLVEGEPLAVRPERVLGFGTPVAGLLEAVKAGEKWDVSLADVGVNIALRGDEAVGFGGGWVVALDLVEENEGVDS